MDRFIPKEKLSKKAKREQAKARRETWGGLSPVTRRPPNPKAYVREKPRYDDGDDTGVFSIADNLRLSANYAPLVPSARPVGHL